MPKGGGLTPVNGDTSLMVRRRVDDLLDRAIDSHFVAIAAKGGCGKTCAVSSWLSRREAEVIWIKFSERDKQLLRAWEHIVSSAAAVSPRAADRLLELGHPETRTQFDQYRAILEEEIDDRDQIIVVIDDLHYVDTNRYIELFHHTIGAAPDNVRWIVITRNAPDLLFLPQGMNESVAYITEEDLNFTREETEEYLSNLGLDLSRETMETAINRSDGWAFAVGLFGQLLRRVSGDNVLATAALKANIEELIEREVVSVATTELLRLLVRMSLLEYLPETIVRSLADDDAEVIRELNNLPVFVRYDGLLHTYSMHQLFKEYIQQQQSQLTEEEKLQTWLCAAEWYRDNGFKIDAAVLYEKAGDWEAIVGLAHSYSQELPESAAAFFLNILERGPQDQLRQIKEYPLLRVRILVSLRRIHDAFKLCCLYIDELPDTPDNNFDSYVLASLWAARGIIELLLVPMTGSLDFCRCFVRVEDLYNTYPYQEHEGQVTNFHVGPYALVIGVNQKIEVKQLLSELESAEASATVAMEGCLGGLSALAQAEYLFCQGELDAAEHHALRAWRQAKVNKQHIIQSRVLSLRLRIAVGLGDYQRAMGVVSDIEDLLRDNENHFRLTSYDILAGSFYSIMGDYDKVAKWLKESLDESRGVISSQIELNISLTKMQLAMRMGHFREVLEFVRHAEDLKVFLLGALELKAAEAVCCFHLGDKPAAYQALTEAWRMAEPHNLRAPLTQMGKSMHRLCTAALKEEGLEIPQAWLRTIATRSSVLAKRVDLVRKEYNRLNSSRDINQLTKREFAILRDMYQGMTRMEIAASQGISVSTVKSMLNGLYAKLGATNNVDAVRIAKDLGLL
ncbi:MAG: LuxR C-terminal-related transcriptional regulator [Coriobacteriales bacterium]|nr:LuxR C-terminal-related transcriptional regulator [Coriobacteriales bacterium]